MLVFRIIRCALPTKSSRLLNFKNAPTALTKVIHQNSCFEKSTHPIFFEKATINFIRQIHTYNYLNRELYFLGLLQMYKLINDIELRKIVNISNICNV